MNARVRAALAATLAVAALLLGGCGDDSPPADRVPSLASDLERVDAAIVDRDFDQAASALDDIEAATEAAVDDGTLSDSDAARILSAVAALRDALAGRAEPPPTESSPTTESPSPPPTDEDDHEEGDGEGEGEDGDNGEGNDDKDKGDKGDKEDKDKGKGDD